MDDLATPATNIAPHLQLCQLADRQCQGLVAVSKSAKDAHRDELCHLPDCACPRCADIDHIDPRLVSPVDVEAQAVQASHILHQPHQLIAVVHKVDGKVLKRRQRQNRTCQRFRDMAVLPSVTQGKQGQPLQPRGGCERLHQPCGVVLIKLNVQVKDLQESESSK